MEVFKRILLVEDDEKDIELTLTTLEEYNLANETVVAHDGVEALDYLYCREAFADRQEGNTLLIMMDLKMPGMNGVQVLREIKADEKMKKIPIVILSSSSDEQDLEECYRLGVNGYVVKPVRFEEFVDKVRGIGVFWTLINKLLPVGKGGVMIR
jgi:CheY-like chemotaxis protein